MAFAPNGTNNKTKNKFVMSMRSKKTDDGIAWINLMDSYVLKIFNKPITEITAEEVQRNIGNIYDSDFHYNLIVDTTAEKPLINPKDF